MKSLLFLSSVLLLLVSCQDKAMDQSIVEDFNQGWKFHLGTINGAEATDFDDSGWTSLNLPHDWSIEEGYQKEGDVASSTGFVLGGIGWYRKSFVLDESDTNKQISVYFEGVYNNSTVWVNENELGTRPNGYSSFSYDLTNYLKHDGTPNVITVKVDRSAYVDSRWYTGAGIYRKVELIKTDPLHIAQWGVQITTPEITDTSAKIQVKTTLDNSKQDENPEIALVYEVLDVEGIAVASKKVEAVDIVSTTEIELANPKIWSLDMPNLYVLKVSVLKDGAKVDEIEEVFGVRSFHFDADKGFFLNGNSMKIKGVNLHHDAGALGAAVPKAIWKYRMMKLKSIGVNAVRLSHNPHAPELLEVCDELGLLVMGEAFDEWHKPKGKNKVYIGDNAASEESSRAYPMHFEEWAERDLKDMIKRDFNHPSVFMWSIGNEIEWTFPYYAKTYGDVNGADKKYYEHIPIYDSLTIKNTFDKNLMGKDTLVEIARKLSNWVKEIDTSRPVTAGSVHPSVGLASGYGDALDVYGFNYRAIEYDPAHKAYPNLNIYGSENWGAYSEWKNCVNRDFVAGIFLWTGFAYLGEAGPWPRKGLNISLFDYAGFKTARGHFYETLWSEKPKVYMVTTPANESEYAFENGNWTFEMQLTPPPVWNMLRLWEWYKTYPKWNYDQDEPIIVQAYTNCEEAELFLNGESLGKQKLAAVVEEDHILKWQVPYTEGELKIVGYNNGDKADEYQLNSQGKLSNIVLKTTKTHIRADGYDTAVISLDLLDENGNLMTDDDRLITFEINGAAKNIGVDNGWEMNVQPHKSDSIITHQGRAVLFLQSTESKGDISIRATVNGIASNELLIKSE